MTDEQAEAYGRFAEEPTRPDLERFFQALSRNRCLSPLVEGAVAPEL
ncbi:hypothetical protein [Streptomyces cellulosae]|uniref:Uncharacterized protein n=1 Tax=Streptomyces cellulosae TaxID=1968 RepID=A0ABW7YFU6_STRCE